MTTTETAQRVNIFKQSPEVYQAMIALDAAAKKGLDPVLVELVLTRASQINHCAWCLDMHTQDARKVGISEQKLYLLNAWEEVPGLYTERERAALALTEAVTVLTDGFVPDEVYARAAEQFEERELSQLIAVIFTINSWNRIAVSTRRVPPIR
ncbi:carboxymuconolactone decarboxylase family protein [Rhodococcus oryzae]|uniref:Carboxymuconolactone decarboxylase family protein n=1 Tax=Rhodococcus oryzae TaxID=2571143 RepID=A0ABY2RD34_9NOCA|nr:MULTISPECIES: carboxymuconolactone decarboxylase family protein [Rhodococcus]AQA22587.1 alkylhydroperoxidase AhpD family core domain protein [Rhodococcus sp. MTM3W5.2]TJZ73262.1 carboxymuconolactone decarboxylase family protein [Rhodococcus oryzae]